MASLSSLVNTRPKVAGIAAVIVIFLAVGGALLLNKAPAAAPDQGDIFFDESTGQFSRHHSSNIPPLPNADGQLTIVRAVVRNEGVKDADLKREDIAYLFRYTPDMKQEHEKSVNPKGGYTAFLLREMDGKEVRSAKEGSPWVGADSPAGRKIVSGE